MGRYSLATKLILKYSKPHPIVVETVASIAALNIDLYARTELAR